MKHLVLPDGNKVLIDESPLSGNSVEKPCDWVAQLSGGYQVKLHKEDSETITSQLRETDEVIICFGELCRAIRRTEWPDANLHGQELYLSELFSKAE